MEDLIIEAMFIVTVICYTVYKIDCNHVSKDKHGVREHKVPTSDELKLLLKHKAEISRPSEETMESLFGKDYKAETGRQPPKPEKGPIPPRKDSE